VPRLPRLATPFRITVYSLGNEPKQACSLAWALDREQLHSRITLIIRLALVAVGIYLVVAIISFMSGNATLVAVALIPVAFVVTRITRPPTYRLQRALKRLRHEFRSMSPAIIETRIEAGKSDALYATLVCAREAEVSPLDAQLNELRRRISVEAIAKGVPAHLADALRVRVVSRQAVDREGGWFGFHRNVAWPRSNER